MNKKTKLLLGTLFITTTVTITTGSVVSCSKTINDEQLPSNKIFEKNFDFCKVFSGTEFDNSNFLLDTLNNQLVCQNSNQTNRNFIELLKLLNFLNSDNIQLQKNIENLKNKIVFYLQVSNLIFKIILNNVHTTHIPSVEVNKIKPNHLISENLNNQINDIYNLDFKQYQPTEINNNFKQAPVIVDNDIYSLNTNDFFVDLNQGFLTKFPNSTSNLQNNEIIETNVSSLKLDLQFYLQNYLKNFLITNNLNFKNALLFLNIKDISFDLISNTFNFIVYFQYVNDTNSDVIFKLKNNNEIVINPNQYITFAFEANNSSLTKTVNYYQDQNYLSYSLNNISFKYEINDLNNIQLINNLNLNFEKSVSINSYLQNSTTNTNNYYDDTVKFETNFSNLDASFFETDLMTKIDIDFNNTKSYIINTIKILEKINNKNLTIGNVLNLISPEISNIVLTTTNDTSIANIVKHLLLNENISAFIFNTYQDIFKILSEKINDPKFDKILSLIYDNIQNSTEQDFKNIITGINALKPFLKLFLQNINLGIDQIESILLLIDQLSLDEPILDFCFKNSNQILTLINTFITDQNIKQMLVNVITFFDELKTNTASQNILTLNFWDVLLNNLNSKQPLINLLTNINTTLQNPILKTIIDFMNASYPNMTVDNVLLTITDLLNPVYIDVNKKPIPNSQLTLVQYIENNLILQKTITTPISYANNKLMGQIDYKYVLSDIGLKFNMRNFKKIFKNTTAKVPISLPIIGQPNLEIAVNLALPNDLYILANTDFKYSYNLNNSDLYPNIINNKLSYKLILETSSDFSGLKPTVDYLGFIKSSIWTKILNEILGHDYTVAQKNHFLYNSQKIINADVSYNNYNLDVVNLKYFVFNGQNDYFINVNQQTNPDLYQQQLNKQQEWNIKKDELLTLLQASEKNDQQIKDSIIQLFVHNSLNVNSQFLLPSIWYYPNKNSNSTSKYIINIILPQKVLYKSKTIVNEVSNYILEFKDIFSFEI